MHYPRVKAEGRSFYHCISRVVDYKGDGSDGSNRDRAARMRFPRVKAEGRSFYHFTSRVVGGRFIFGSSAGSCFDAVEFLTLMLRSEAFSGVGS
jgi:hypothetical protein